MSVTGIATKITCTNPGGKQAPGQNKPRVTSLGTQTITRDEVKNGTVTIRVTTAEPARFTPKQAGCPNNNWTAKIDDVSFSSATITVVQGGRTQPVIARSSASRSDGFTLRSFEGHNDEGCRSSWRTIDLTNDSAHGFETPCGFDFFACLPDAMI